MKTNVIVFAVFLYFLIYTDYSNNYLNNVYSRDSLYCRYTFTYSILLENDDNSFTTNDITILNDLTVVTPANLTILSYSNGDTLLYTELNGNVNSSGSFRIKILNQLISIPFYNYTCELPPFPLVNTLDTTVWVPSIDGVYFYSTIKLNTNRFIPNLISLEPFNIFQPYEMVYDFTNVNKVWSCYQGYDTIVLKIRLNMFGIEPGISIDPIIKLVFVDSLGRGSTITLPTFLQNSIGANILRNIYVETQISLYPAKQFNSILTVNSDQTILPYYQFYFKDTNGMNLLGSTIVASDINNRVYYTKQRLIENDPAITFPIYMIQNLSVNVPGDIGYNSDINPAVSLTVYCKPNPIIDTVRNTLAMGINIDNYTPFTFSQYYGEYVQDKKLVFPYGVITAQGRSMLAYTSYVISDYLNNLVQELQMVANYTQYVIQPIDSTIPVILEIQFNDLNGPFTVLRIKAQDTGSGVFKIIYRLERGGDVIELNLSDQIDLTNGIATFEKVIDINQFNYPLSKRRDITIYDQAGNLREYKDYFMARPIPFSDKFSLININNMFPSKITFLKFAIPHIDMNILGCENTLFVNFDRVQKDSVVRLKLDIDESKVFIGHWDSIKNMYRIPFTLEARPVSSDNVYFEINYLSIPFSSVSLPSYGINEKLSVYSDIADRMPPIVSSIVKNSDVTSSSGGEVSWNVTIEDFPNGIKNLTIYVSSDLDLYTPVVKRVFKATPEMGVVQTKEIVMTVNVPPNCLPQTYLITYVETFDNSNVRGVYDMYFQYTDINSNYMNPMMKFVETVVPAYANCGPPPVVDTKPPSLNITSIDNINGIVSFVVYDTESKISLNTLPVCYFHGEFLEVINVTAQILLISMSEMEVSYTCQINFPRGFALPQLVAYISIHGYSDVQYNYGGVHINQLADNFIQVQPKPEITQVSDVYSNGNQVTIYGSGFGTSISNIFQVHIVMGRSTPYLPLFTTNCFVVVNLPPISEPKIGIFLMINTTTSNTVQVNVKQYVAPPVISCQGTPECGGPSNGLCTSNGCQCKSPWIGNDCLSQQIIVVPVINSTNPDINNDFNSTLPNGETVTLKSLISILALNEVDRNGQVKVPHNFTTWIYTNTTSNTSIANQEYQYLTNITNLGVTTSVKIILQYFSKSQTIYFANEQLNMLPSTIKYQIELSPYAFSSSLNSLQLVMSASIESTGSNVDSCTYQESGDATESDSNYIKLQVNQHSIYGRYIKRGIIDNRVQAISNTVLKPTSESTSTLSQTNIGINIPHYINTVLIDPDFSILLDTKPASEKENSICNNYESDSTKLSKSQIAGIVIGVVGFAAVVAISITYYFYKKKREQINLARIHNKLQSK
ncbi:hypothetical protein DLAC_00797 [Tieghemostelium lacteum]|uniref:EGF-like domain-containing protein n=1 Tax=Tieghemostelium lacteum TaxID=361077 RepID=A0A152A726_TIELA|nr:hypothetical protein DLAC_00797 [Tieghemostelium lacteum]|eukprot:KYR02004.1 hypothetical protein DLAC_00797 [Tieghemostelium lacteum]